LAVIAVVVVVVAAADVITPSDLDFVFIIDYFVTKALEYWLY